PVDVPPVVRVPSVGLDRYTACSLPYTWRRESRESPTGSPPLRARMPTENEFDKQNLPDDPRRPPEGDGAAGPPGDDPNRITTAPPTVPWVVSPESIAVPTDNVGTWLTRGDGAPPPLEEYIPLPSVPGYEVLEEL